MTLYKKKITSRFIAEAEDGVFYNSGRPITQEDETYANDVWATVTGKRPGKK